MTNDWKTSIAGIIFLAIAVLLWHHDITVRDALQLLSAAAAYLAFMAKDKDTGSTKPSPEVDAAVDKVEAMPPDTRP